VEHDYSINQQENAMYSKTPSGDYVIVDRREQLKVKIKSLATEARIIRHAELKTRGALREELYLHRVHVVRREARSSLIAYAIIRGKSLEKAETAPRMPPDWETVRRMCKKYGPSSLELPKAALPTVSTA